MKKLWQKKVKNDKLVDQYCFEEGAAIDNNLIEADVYGSIAHSQALVKLKVITKKESIKIVNTLKEILVLKKVGKFTVNFSDEDVHTKIENYLIKKLGNLGGKIHTARSRNDQILVDLRLYTKEQLFKIAFKALKLIQTFYFFAQKYEFVPMPGYTHMQKAMPSSVGMWSGSFAESLLDDLKILKLAFELNNQCPLGTGAAYGLPISIDRELTSKLLEFDKAQNNSLYTQASRPKTQILVMGALVQIMLTLSRFAQDLLLFTTSEFNFFSVAEKMCTGSSIMPQKKNLDVMEYLRAKTHLVLSYQQAVVSISAGLPSGYNADFGETKGPFLKSMEIIEQTLEIVNLTVESLSPNKEVLKKSMCPELFATQAAYELVKKKVPFRKAYKMIGKSLNSLPSYDIVKTLKLSIHTGGTGNLALEKILKEKDSYKKWWKKKNTDHALMKGKLRQLI